jgi:hypothetical protein
MRPSNRHADNFVRRTFRPFEIGSTGNGRNPIFNGKAAAFMPWHEPDDASGVKSGSVRGPGEIPQAYSAGPGVTGT